MGAPGRLFIAGRDPVAVIPSRLRVMRINPDKINYLWLASRGRKIADMGKRDPPDEEIQAVAEPLDPDFGILRY